MNILILGGFLGSGKTSVLLELAKYLVKKDTATKPVKVAIIENEIGETGVDGIAIKSAGLVVKDIFAGCVCCTVSSDLIVGIHDIQKTLSPDWIIIETTGLAKPDSVAENIKAYVKHERILITIIVDAFRWNELSDILYPLTTAQVKAAQAILLNKIDLVTTEELKLISADLKKINPNAEIIELSAIHGVPVSFIDSILN